MVITIIVLLILAGITIQVVSGDGGLLNTGEDTADKTKVAKIEDQINLAIYTATDMKTGEIDPLQLEKLLKEIVGVENVIHNEDEDSITVIYATDRERKIELH